MRAESKAAEMMSSFDKCSWKAGTTQLPLLL